MFTHRSAFRKICAVDNYFRGCNVAKGQLLLSHVDDAVQSIGDDIVLAKGKCVSQVKDDAVYDVELELSWSCPLKRELRISWGKCTCIAGVRGASMQWLYASTSTAMRRTAAQADLSSGESPAQNPGCRDHNTYQTWCLVRNQQLQTSKLCQEQH